MVSHKENNFDLCKLALAKMDYLVLNDEIETMPWQTTATRMIWEALGI
jgi:hypothetical protein